MGFAERMVCAPAWGELEFRRHRPETTVLSKLVERHWPELESLLERRGESLPKYVCEEFESYLRCGRLEHGFLRVACEDCREERRVAT